VTTTAQRSIAMPRSPRAQQLADELRRATGELLATLEAASVEQWRLVVRTEGRSVGVVAHHLASGYPQVFQLVELAVAGQPFPPLTQAMIDAGNAQHAEASAGCGKAETIDLLSRNTARVSAAIRELDDEDLALTGSAPYFGPIPISVEQLIMGGLIEHTLEHLGSIRTALATGDGA
jgi:hypothetical protein